MLTGVTYPYCLWLHSLSLSLARPFVPILRIEFNSPQQTLDC